MFEGFLCAEGHCLNVQDNKSSHHGLRAWGVLEEGEDSKETPRRKLRRAFAREED